jgi:hypothetical protein
VYENQLAMIVCCKLPYGRCWRPSVRCLSIVRHWTGRSGKSCAWIRSAGR